MSAVRQVRVATDSSSQTQLLVISTIKVVSLSLFKSTVDPFIASSENICLSSKHKTKQLCVRCHM